MMKDKPQRKDDTAKMKVSLEAPLADVANVLYYKTLTHISPNNLDTECDDSEEVKPIKVLGRKDSRQTGILLGPGER